MQGGGNFWTRLKHQEQLPRSNHAAVLDPVTRRLLVLGGFGKGGRCGNECLDNNEISKMTFQAVPLKTLAVEYVARTIERGDPRLEKDQLPPNLKTRSLGITLIKFLVFGVKVDTKSLNHPFPQTLLIHPVSITTEAKTSSGFIEPICTLKTSNVFMPTN